MGKVWSKRSKHSSEKYRIRRRQVETDYQDVCAEAGGKGGVRPPPPVATPEVTSPLPLSLPVTVSSSPGQVKLWDMNNTEQRQIVSLSEQYRNLLKEKLSELTENVHLSPLIPHLLQLGVIDKQTRDTIQLNAIEATQTLRLIDHLERGPCWRLHGFLRALALTQQPHIVILLGFSPEDYEEVNTSWPTPSTSKIQKTHFYRRIGSEERLQISNDLLPGLLQHCGSYDRTLMRSSLFGHKDGVSIDLTNVWVSTMAKCKQNQSTCESIGKMEMFQRLFQRHPPNTVSLEGVAGAGKSAFMQEYAYRWSREVTSCEDRGAEVPCNGHTWWMVLYIPLWSIRGTFIDVIWDSLKCDPYLKQQMMAEIKKDGKGVLVIGDGIDELRDEASEQSLLEFTKTSQEMMAKPTVLITARNGLLSIPHLHFDRELHIKGFSLQQGVDYVAKYFKAMYQITEHPVLEYICTHQEELGWVLINPLQVHILSELAASGFLTLDDVKTLTTIKLFRNLDHQMVTRDTECRGIGSDSSNFYKACLRCLLNNERQITEEEVGCGSPYLSILTKYTYRNQNYKECHSYGFPHEVLFEYFAMRGVIDYITSKPAHMKALLLFLCTDENMWNVLRLTCGFIIQYEHEVLRDTAVAIIRCCLILQTHIEPCVKNELTGELLKLPAKIQDNFPQDLLSCGLTTEQIAKMDRMFDLIQDMFIDPGECLKKYGWARTAAKDGFWSGFSSLHRFILDCLEWCTPEVQSSILRNTTYQLLPCAMHDQQPDYDKCVVPVNGKFAIARRSEDAMLRISIWCLQDLIPTLQSHKSLHQLLQSDERRYSRQLTMLTKLNLTRQYDSIHLYVNCGMKDLWGAVPTGGWAEEEWVPALRQLLLQYDMRHIVISVDDTAPLSGLLSACKKIFTPQHKLTGGLNIVNGKVPEDHLLSFLDWAHGVQLPVDVRLLTVVVAAGHDSEPELWHTVHTTISQKVALVKGGNVFKPTYVSARGQLLCEQFES